MVINEVEIHSSTKEGVTFPKPLGAVRFGIGTIRHHLAMAGLVVVLVWFMAGCAPAEVDQPSTEETVTVSAGPGSIFKPDVITVDQGHPVRLMVKNLNSITHTFTVDELEIDIHLAPGGQQEITFTPTEVGIFEFYCAEPGHRDAGMIGKLVVGEEPVLPNGLDVTDEEDNGNVISPGY